MCRDRSDRAIVRWLAVLRWGETGFRCDRCGHLRGKPVAGRERVRRCGACHHQQSVTAGTAMHGTRLPLWTWLRRAEHWEAGELPTATRLATDLGVARSTAWHLNQRFLRVLFLGVAPAEVGEHLVQLRCRRPKGRDTDEQRPPHVRALLERFATAPRRSPRNVDAAITFDGARPALSELAVPPSRFEAARRAFIVGRFHDLRDLHRQLVTLIQVRHHGVCLRWLSRYLDHYLGILSVMRRWCEPPDWARLLVSSPRRCLQELRAEPTPAAVQALRPGPASPCRAA